MVCDSAGNTVRQGYCCTCLAIGGYFGRVTKDPGNLLNLIFVIGPDPVGSDCTHQKSLRVVFKIDLN